MAATFEFQEDNGAATGSPAKGTVRNTAVSQVNWKSVDDVATAYTASPVVAGANSMTSISSDVSQVRSTRSVVVFTLTLQARLQLALLLKVLSQVRTQRHLRLLTQL